MPRASADERRDGLGTHRHALRCAHAARSITDRGVEPLRRRRDGLWSGSGTGDRRRLTSEPALKAYHLLPSVRGDLLKKLGRFDEARLELERAASLTRNARERALLMEKAAELRR